MSLLALLVVVTAILWRRIVAASHIAWGPWAPLMRVCGGRWLHLDQLRRPAMIRRPGDNEQEPPGGCAAERLRQFRKSRRPSQPEPDSWWRAGWQHGGGYATHRGEVRGQGPRQEVSPDATEADGGKARQRLSEGGLYSLGPH